MREPPTVEIDVDDRIPRANLTQFEEYQGDLKPLSKQDHDALRGSILRKKFFSPVFVWQNAPGNGTHMKIVDGHQRIRVLRGLEADGYRIPPVPFVPIHASSMQDAKEKILLITSSFGKISTDGLWKFIIESDLNPMIVSTDLSLMIQPLDTGKFLDEFLHDHGNKYAAPPPKDPGRSASGAVQKLQLSFTADRHQAVMANIEKLKLVFESDNASDVVDQALQSLVEGAEART